MTASQEQDKNELAASYIIRNSKAPDSTVAATMKRVVFDLTFVQ